MTKRQGDAAAASSSYIFDQSTSAEAHRLDVLQQLRDPPTQRRITALGAQRGWHCLEVGAGRGSIAQWLSRVVGLEGHVVALDLDPLALEDISGPLEVLCADVLDADLPSQSFDLVHARLVLAHVPDRRAAIARMVSWLRPGGYLLLEEADQLSLILGTDEPVDALWRGLQRATPSVNYNSGRALLGELGKIGLAEIDGEVDVDVIRGATPLAEFYRLSVEMLAPIAHRRGTATEQEIADYQAKLTDPAYRSLGIAWVAAWGRRVRS